MKTKFLLFTAALLLNASVFAQSGTCGANLTWNLRNDTLTISGTGAMANYTIADDTPNSPWYSYRLSITKVVINSGVTSIGSRAFSGCVSLTSVTIPESVTSIGSNAFSSCVSLTSMTIPESVTSIGDDAFSSCNKLATVNYNATKCTTMGSSSSYSVFRFCTALTTINIGSNVKNIPSYAFQNCSSLASVTIPESVTSIGSRAFSGCSSLASVTIPKSVTVIESQVFYNCNLVSLTIPNSVTSIGSEAFVGNYNLMKLVIEDGSTPLRLYRGISYYSSLAGGYNGTTNGSFGNTDIIGTVYLGRNLTAEKVTSAGGAERNPLAIFGQYVKELIIGNNVTSLPEYSFYECWKLTSIIISENVKSLSFGTSAFFGCNSLTDVFNLNPEPPVINSVGRIKTSEVRLYVPFGSAELYRNATLWKDFIIVEDQIDVAAAADTAVVSWVTNKNAEGYTLILFRDTERTDTIEVYHLDKQGKLLRSATEQEVLQFTLPGLTASTTYYYTLKTLGANEAVLMRSSSSFETRSTTALGDVSADKGTVVSEQFYDILGRRLSAAPTQGLHIKRTTYDSGVVESEKVLRR